MITHGCLLLLFAVQSETAQERASAPALEVHFAPSEFLVAHTAKPVGLGYQGNRAYYDLVLQALAFVNVSDRPLTIEGGWIDAVADGQVLLRQAIAPDEIQRALQSAAAMVQMNFPAALDVQFWLGEMLPADVTLGRSLTLQPNAAALVDDYYLAVRGLPDEVRVSVSGCDEDGREVAGEGVIPVESYQLAND